MSLLQASHIDSELGSRWSLPALPNAFILELDLDQNNVVEVESRSPLDILFNSGSQALSLRRAVSGIVNAGEDDRVKGFLATGNLYVFATCTASICSTDWDNYSGRSSLA